MLLVAAYRSDANAASDLPKQKVIWKPMKIYSPPTRRFKMKSARIDCCFFNERIQLSPKFISQSRVYSVVVSEDFRDVLLNIRVINDIHRPRSC